MNEISENMKKCWENPFSTKYDPRYLLKIGSDEIDRLEKIIQDIYKNAKNGYNTKNPPNS